MSIFMPSSVTAAAASKKCARRATASRRNWPPCALLIIDHTECWQFDDPRIAEEARCYRKEKKRRGTWLRACSIAAAI